MRVKGNIEGKAPQNFFYSVKPVSRKCGGTSETVQSDIEFTLREGCGAYGKLYENSSRCRAWL